MPRVAGGQPTFLPGTQAIVVVTEDALSKCFVHPVERSHSRACSGGYWGWKGGEEEESCAKSRQSCIRDVSCTCTIVNDFKVFISSMSKETVMGEGKILIALYMLQQ